MSKEPAKGDDEPKKKTEGAAKAKKAAAKPKKKAKSRKKQPKGLTVFTEAGNVPRWVSAARLVLVLALAASVPFVIGVEPGRRLFWAAAIASLPLFLSLIHI